jgi:glycosyltransferase involved in cell wall biosynthesis
MVPEDQRAADDEVVLIHLGNNPHHLWLLPRFETDRCVVVLHDAVLHHLLVEAADREAGVGLLDGLERAHGAAGAALARARANGHHGRLDPFLFPARRAYLEHARAVVVHSDWAAGTIEREFPGKPVGRVPLAAADPHPVDRAAARSELGIRPDEIVLMHLGFLSPEKGLEEIFTAVAAAAEAGIDLRLVVVGEGRDSATLTAVAERLDLGERVLVTGWIEPGVFAGIPAAADLGVVLRTPSAGETSAAVLRFFSCGVPVAVGGNRQFLEWPEKAAPRLTPGPSAAAELARLLGEVGDPAFAARGRAAREAYEAAHRPEIVADRLTGFLDGLGEA